jgi:hypothetical protein
VLHPAHPLQGQVFPVEQQSGEEVLIQLINGQQYFIPVDWTDQAPGQISLPGARFLLEHLLALCKCIEALSLTNQKEGTIPSQNKQRAEGDRHATAGSVHIGPAFPGTACPGDRPSGTDNPAAVEQAGGGGAK